MDNDGNPCVHSGRIASEFFKNGMVVTFDKPCRTIERNDTLAIRTHDAIVFLARTRGRKPRSDDVSNANVRILRDDPSPFEGS